MQIKLRSEAAAAGDITYYTGKSCKNGHVTYRYVKNGACSECVKTNNGQEVSPNHEQRKVDKQDLIRGMFYIPDQSRADFSAAVWAFAVMRYPLLTQSDIDPHLLPANRSNDIAGHAFYCHPDDFKAIKSLSDSMRGSNIARIARDNADRLKATLAAATVADSTPLINFK